MSSKQRRGGLGRGLGALIPTAPAPADADGGPASPAVPGVPTVSSGRPGPTDSFFTPTTPAATPTEPAAPAAASAAQPAADDSGLIPVAGASFAELPVAAIHPNAKNPRQVFDEDALAELTHSIREFGVLQPVVVRPDAESPGQYELVMGERRFRASQAAGL